MKHYYSTNARGTSETNESTQEQKPSEAIVSVKGGEMQQEYFNSEPNYPDYYIPSDDGEKSYDELVADFESNDLPPSSPPEWLSETPEPDYSDTCIPSDDDEKSYDDLKQSFEPASTTEPLPSPVEDWRKEVLKPLAGKRVYELPVFHQNINDGNKTVIDQQYLGNSIADALKIHRGLVVGSDMGSGKTTAIMAHINSLSNNSTVLYVSSRKRLIYAMSKEMAIKYYEDLASGTVEDKDGKPRKMTAKEKRDSFGKLGVTPQTIGNFYKANPSLSFDLMILDESESILEMINSRVAKNKDDIVTALKELAEKANNVVLMDAHAGAQTAALAKTLGFSSPHWLINNYKTWDFVDCTVLEGGDFKERRQVMRAKIYNSLNGNDNIAFSSNSQKYTEKMYNSCVSSFRDKKFLLLDGNSGGEIDAFLDPENMQKMRDTGNSGYDGIFYTPAISVGVSFDAENIVDVVYGDYINLEHTGTPDDAVQSMARFRKPTKNASGRASWIINLDDATYVIKRSDIPELITKNVMDRTNRAHKLGGVDGFVGGDVANDLIRMYSVFDSNRVKTKNNFKHHFLQRLASKGIRNIFDDITEANEVSEEAEDSIAEASDKMKAKEIAAKTTSERISEEKYTELDMQRKFSKELLTEKESDSMERFNFEKHMLINCDKLDAEAIKAHLTLDNDNATNKCISREQLLGIKENPEFVKKYMQARVEGLDGEFYKTSVISDYLDLPLKVKILSYALPYQPDTLQENKAALKKVAKKEASLIKVEAKAAELVSKSAKRLADTEDKMNERIEKAELRIASKETKPTIKKKAVGIIDRAKQSIVDAGLKVDLTIKKQDEKVAKANADLLEAKKELSVKAKVVGKEFNKKMFTAPNELFKFYKFIKENEQEIRNLGVFNLGNWKKDPSILMANALNALGYRVNESENGYIAVKHDLFEELYQRRQDQGENWVDWTASKLRANDLLSKDERADEIEEKKLMKGVGNHSVKPQKEKSVYTEVINSDLYKAFGVSCTNPAQNSVIVTATKGMSFGKMKAFQNMMINQAKTQTLGDAIKALAQS